MPKEVHDYILHLAVSLPVPLPEVLVRLPLPLPREIVTVDVSLVFEQNGLVRSGFDH